MKEPARTEVCRLKLAGWLAGCKTGVMTSWRHIVPLLHLMISFRQLFFWLYSFQVSSGETIAGRVRHRPCPHMSGAGQDRELPPFTLLFPGFRRGSSISRASDSAKTDAGGRAEEKGTICFSVFQVPDCLLVP